MGALLLDEIYRFRVETWTVPNLDYNTMTLQSALDSVTHKVRSNLEKFMAKGVDGEE